MCAAETDNAVAVFTTTAVDHGERHKRVSPSSVQMERNLIMTLAGRVEIELFGGMDEDGHRDLPLMQSPAYGLAGLTVKKRTVILSGIMDKATSAAYFRSRIVGSGSVWITNVARTLSRNHSVESRGCMVFLELVSAVRD